MQGLLNAVLFLASNTDTSPTFGILIFLIGLLVVFAVLLVLVFVVMVCKFVVSKLDRTPKEKKDKEVEVKAVPQSAAAITADVSEEERAAVIAAVVAIMTAEGGTSTAGTPPFRVKSIYRN